MLSWLLCMLTCLRPRRTGDVITRYDDFITAGETHLLIAPNSEHSLASGIPEVVESMGTMISSLANGQCSAVLCCAVVLCCCAVRCGAVRLAVQ